MAGSRLDVLVVEQGLAASRELAQRLIRAGQVRHNGLPLTKPGKTYPEHTVLTVDTPPRFVSRGGEKLQGALDAWPIDLTGRDCIDLGASTGGFTDCMLQSGASRVIAVDVGHGQLAWSLRQDERVEVMEQVNARHLEAKDIPFVPSFFSIDVSFISLEKILPAVVRVLPEGEGVSLIKPQFEAGRDQVERGGVVRNPAVHKAVVDRIVAFGESIGLHCKATQLSPLKGPAGNIEFLAWWSHGSTA